ncbi:hypothetical protein DSUL_20108 [Desulfovibrionales bacterium]
MQHFPLSPTTPNTKKNGLHSEKNAILAPNLTAKKQILADQSCKYPTRPEEEELRLRMFPTGSYYLGEPDDHLSDPSVAR